MLKPFDLKKCGLVCLCLTSVAAFLAMPALATAETVDWSRTFALQELILQHPRVLASINPQPEPPGEAVLDLTDPANPIITRDTGGEGTFRILFALAGPVPLFVPYVGAPDNNGHLEFDVHDESEIVVYRVSMDIFTSSGGFPLERSWTRINPQPEPPLPAGAASVGFDFLFSSYSTATLSFQVSGTGSQTFHFTLAPVPGALLLLSSGLLGLMACGRLRQ